MSDNEQVMSVLLSIREDIGELKGTIKGFAEIPERVLTLELSHARQKGAAKVWHMISTGVGAAVGAAATLLGSSHR